MRNKGQSSLELTLLFLIVIAALLVSQVYMKRGLQGHLRTQSDQFGEQFSPGSTTSNMTISSYSDTDEKIGTAGLPEGETQISINNQWQSRFGTETVMNEASEFWAAMP